MHIALRVLIFLVGAWIILWGYACFVFEMSEYRRHMTWGARFAMLFFPITLPYNRLFHGDKWKHTSKDE